MKILVVTPTLGRSPWLAETVASVAQLSEAPDHVLVAPQAETGRLARLFPSARVVAEPGGGMYAAINAGVESVPAWDAVTYLNDDDLLLPGFSAAAAIVAARQDQPFFAYGGVRLIDPTGRRLGAIPVSRFPGQNRALYAERLEPVYQHGTLVTRVAWERHGGCNPAFRLVGDSEWLARLCVAGVPAACVAGEVAAFRLHPGQLTKQRAAMREERRQVDEKLGLLAPRRPWRQCWARLVFRAANLPVYAERLARHGWKSFDDLLEAGDQP